MKNNLIRHIEPHECRVLRSILNWNQDKLAQNSQVSKKTIVFFEKGKQIPKDSILKKIKNSFLSEGAFVDRSDNGKNIIFSLKKDGSNNSGAIKFVDSDLLVIKSFIIGSGIKQKLLNDFSVINKRYEWSDRILFDLNQNICDIGIYNKNRTKKIVNSFGMENIDILDDVCYSMGGDSFFLIGKKNKWVNFSLSKLLDFIESNKVTILIAKNSDNLDNIGLLADINHSNLKIINLPSENIRDEIFEINENILIYGNQNIRYDLLYNDSLCEVANSYDIKEKNIRSVIYSNSLNSFVVSKEIYKKIPKIKLQKLLKETSISFNNFVFNDELGVENLINEIKLQMKNTSISSSKLDFIVRNILFKTYKAGYPV